MINAEIKPGYTSVETRSLYQWDYGQTLEIKGALTDQKEVEIQFSIEDSDKAIVQPNQISDGVIRTKIPDVLLQEGKKIYAYVFLHDKDSGATMYTVHMNVIARPKPDYYICAPWEHATWNMLDKRISKLEKLIEEMQGESPKIDPASISVLTDWEFSKDGNTYTKITVPHTCNMEDGQSSALYRGMTYYRMDLPVAAQEEEKIYWLVFESAGQKSKVYVDNTFVQEYKGGYTPFAVKINGLKAGVHELRVECDNTADLDLIPVSADFNFNNGLHKPVYLFKQSTIGFEPAYYGIDRTHITQTEVSEEAANFQVNSRIFNTGNTEKRVKVRFSLLEGERSILTEEKALAVPPDGVADYAADYTLESPHLWNGKEDPYLYTVRLELLAGDSIIDKIEARTGFRFFSLDPEKGFLLNGHPYTLRGVAVHQDYPGKMSAMSSEDFDNDYAIVQEVGATVVRLAHYPHSQYAFEKCDELGLVVQTEIPWINHCGVNATEEYFECIKKNLKSMITNYYNHPSIIFWGMSNELNGTHWKSGSGYTDPQGDYDYTKALEWNNNLYSYAKTLDNGRLIGLTTHDNTFLGNQARTKEWNADWIGSNQYKGWYGSAFPAFGTTMDNYRKQTPFWAVTEYGAGANSAHHSLTPQATTNTGSGGARHDEEYQNIFHESYLEQIQARPWLIFTSIWALFDFAVAGRNEGGNPYTNDKGIVTRDRKTKKDAFYLYKAAWSKEPVAYITSRRFTNRETDRIAIKAYANTESLSLYRGDVLLQTLNQSSKCGVVWEFDSVLFQESIESFRILGTKDNIEVSDEVLFSTSLLPADAYTVSYQAGTGGTIQGNVLQTVASGGSTETVTAVPDEGFVFEAWSDGKTEAARREENVTSNADYKATFSKDVPYYVDIDFMEIDNSNLTVRDKMGRATVVLEGFAGTATSGSNGFGLSNIDGTGIVKISGLNLGNITGEIEIGIDFADIPQNTDVHRGRIMKAVGVSDVYHMRSSESGYGRINITCETDPSNVGTWYGGADYDTTNERIRFLLDEEKRCQQITWYLTEHGIEKEVYTDTLTDRTDSKIKDVRTYMGNLADTPELFLLNREGLDRPLKCTLKRFFIRSKQ